LKGPKIKIKKSKQKIVGVKTTTKNLMSLTTTKMKSPIKKAKKSENRKLAK
jgi:hypothetical protein